MEGLDGSKRGRENGESSLPEAKRFHADLLRNILIEDDSDTVERDAADVEQATVIKSLQEDFTIPQTTIPTTEVEGIPVEIGYLQEASDDELGIPPPADSSAGDGVENEAVDEFGRIWGYEDDVLPAWYEGIVEFGFMTQWAYGEVA